MASLLELVEALVRDPQAKAAYRADPDDFLGRHGFGELEPSDLEEALHHAAVVTATEDHRLPPISPTEQPASPRDRVAIELTARVAIRRRDVDTPYLLVSDVLLNPYGC